MKNRITIADLMLDTEEEKEKKVVQECVRNIRREISSSFGVVERILDQMENNVETLSGLMRLKSRLLNTLARTLPLSTSHCPFCMFHDDDCEHCFYGKVNGMCKYNYTSVYQSISRSQSELCDSISKYWTEENDRDWKEFSSTPKIKQVTDKDELIIGQVYFTTTEKIDITLNGIKSNCSDDSLVPIEKIFTVTSEPRQYSYKDSTINGAWMVEYTWMIDFKRESKWRESKWAESGKYRSHLFLQDYGIPKPVYSDRRTWTYDESVKYMTWGQLKKFIKV